jgi:hypothetical protein
MRIRKCTFSCPAYPDLLLQLIQLSTKLLLVLLQVGCAVIFDLKRIFIRFEANTTDFIRLFCIKANQRILNLKQIKTEANIPC